MLIKLILPNFELVRQILFYSFVMSKYPRPAGRDDFRIAVICALESESDAVEAMFDQDWEETENIPKLTEMTTPTQWVG